MNPVSIDSNIPGHPLWTPGSWFDLRIFNLYNKHGPDEPGPLLANLETYEPNFGFGGDGERFGGFNESFSFGSGLFIFGGTSGRWVLVGVGEEGGPINYGWRWKEAVATHINPVVLDLDGDGIELTDAALSPGFDFFQTGHAKTTGWFAGGDGLLVLDGNQNGYVDNGSEISFLHHSPGASTDLQALAAFDSNGNAMLDASDTQFSYFRIWRDHNFNGFSDPGELLALSTHGVHSIGLQGSGGGYEVNGNVVHAVSTFTRSDGSTGGAYDVGFEAFSRGSRLASENDLWSVQMLETGETVAVVKPGFGGLTISDLGTYQANGTNPTGFQFGEHNDNVRTSTWGSDRALYVDGGNGDDTIDLSSSNHGSVIKGGDGSDYILGSTGNDNITAGGGYWDRIIDESGDDYYIIGTSRYNTIYDRSGNDVAVIGLNFNQVRFYNHGGNAVVEALDATFQARFMDMPHNPSEGVEYVIFNDRTLDRNEFLQLVHDGGFIESSRMVSIEPGPDMTASSGPDPWSVNTLMIA